ncbi:hypothetical protein PV08_06345 [Exophiala spinifera]|uniref:Major facilitator superfamily (MFS) profile domain-containing protein n=1 Tax=Exophiala spinifera TaxID=91928 RepID=A0A0D2BYA1_9EURO|nr:uncharacterized protein PV08_06345 [Exophiala spinifera]KIW16294.1 hypothetical protein PV08_06345 [Exophiala spinifera]
MSKVEVQLTTPVETEFSLAGELSHLSREEYAAAERKFVRKIDLRLMPILVTIIILNYLDRNALANARVLGIEKDLNLKGTDFNTCISVFFAGYLAIQIPSNLILTRVRPSIYLPACMAAWGLISGLSAVTHNFSGLVVVRFFLGVVEGPYFPGSLFLLSSWYTRKELALRTSVLYTGSLMAGGLGGLVGAGIQSGLDGAMGITAWRWLFIVEASITVFIALCAMFILPDFPHNTKFLSPQERAIAVRRLQEMNGSRDTERGSLLHGARLAVCDYKVWLLALIIITKTSAGAVTSFIPTLVKNFGYGKIETLLLVAPPYFFAALMALAISYSSDRFSERSIHIIAPISLAMAGYIIASASMALAARYLSLFLMLGGVYGSYNVALAWISSTLPRPVEKRSAAIALVNTLGNLAQIYSPYMYLANLGPRYLAAMVANACFCVACALATLALRWALVKENAKLLNAETAVHHADKDNTGYVEHGGEHERSVPSMGERFRYIL